MLNSNCIVNTNKAEYEEYLTRRKLKKSEKNKVENIERDISTLRNEITEIKDLLRSLVNGNLKKSLLIQRQGLHIHVT